MKLRFIDEVSLLTIKSNLPNLINKFNAVSGEWLEEVLGKSPFTDTKYPPIDDFVLDMSDDEPFMTEARNVELVYDRLKFLTNSQASDERIWAALCLGEFWSYVQYRWKIRQKCTAANIEQHYFFGYGPRRSLTRNAISRLWWIGRLTYDGCAHDHYRLTKFVCENSDNIMNVLERNTSNSPVITRAFLSATLDARENEHLVINTNTIGELSKYLNLLGGIYILDCLPEQEIYKKILNKAREITSGKRDFGLSSFSAPR